MNSEQLSFDFDAPSINTLRLTATYEANIGEVGDAAWQAREAEAREYWRPGMATSLPLFCDIDGAGPRYTQMLPGVVESIAHDLACVRIYAAPEYCYTLENYPLHLALATMVPLRDLARHGLNSGLVRVTQAGLMATGDAALAAEIRARRSNANVSHECDLEVPA